MKDIINLTGKTIVVQTIDRKRKLNEFPAGKPVEITATMRLEEEAWTEDVKIIYFGPVFSDIPDYEENGNKLYIVDESAIKYLKSLDRPLDDIIFPIVTKQNKKDNIIYCTYFMKIR